MIRSRLLAMVCLLLVGLSSAAVAADWLVLLYLDADDEMLEEDIWRDLNEAELVGSSADVKIVAQLDRYDGGFEGDGAWSEARRYEVTVDDDFFALSSLPAASLGEISMGDRETLIDFATWGITTYPADNVALILSDHGTGWLGGWTDDDPVEGDMLSPADLDAAFESIRLRTGLDRFALVGFDACLMAHIEVAAMLEPHAQIMVASQEVEPGVGWAYFDFLSALRADSSMSPEALARAIVDSYLVRDVVVADDLARALFLMETFYELDDDQRADLRLMSPNELNRLVQDEGLPSAADFLQYVLGIEETTLSAVDLDALGSVLQELDRLVAALADEDPSIVANARAYAQSYTDVFDASSPSYIDLGHFAGIAADLSAGSDVASAAASLASAIDDAVIAERHGEAVSGSTGLSIYFPGAALFDEFYAGADVYRLFVRRFADLTTWDDFLVSFYESADPTVAATLPGHGTISMEPVWTSDPVVAPGEIAALETTITGDNIAYIFSFSGLAYPDGSVLMVDRDFMIAESDKDVGGVNFPDWPQSEPIYIALPWEALIWTIADGVTEDSALLDPESYGTATESSTYSVTGIYEFSESGEQRAAVAIFQDGAMRRVYGFQQEEGYGAPRQIQIRSGDRFTVLRQWIEGVDEVTGETLYSVAPGETFVLGSSPLEWSSKDAWEGEYVVGFQAVDYEGTLTASYESVVVTEDPNLLWTPGTLYRDDFRPSSLWPESIDDESMTFIDLDYGDFNMWFGQPSWYRVSWSPYGDEYPSSFIVEADVEVLDLHEENDAAGGLAWGPGSDHFYAFMIDDWGFYKLDYLDPATGFETIVDWTFIPNEVQWLPSSNQVRAYVGDEIVRLFVNGIVVEELSIPSLGPGRIGLYGESLEVGNVEVWFDHFQVWGDPDSASSAQVVFDDDFWSTGFDWGEEDWGSFGSNYVNGEYAIWVSDNDFWQGMYAPLDPVSGDLSIETTAYESSFGQDGAYGILWGLDWGTFYLFEVSSDGYYHVAHRQDGEWQTDPVPWTQSADVLTGGNPNTVRLDLLDGQAYLTVNGTTVDSFWPTDWTSFLVGIGGTAYQYVPFEARFSRFTVSVP